MRAAPDVISGMRVRNQTSRPAEVPAGLYARISAFMADRGRPQPKRAKTPYEIVFESRYASHRIQIDSPEPDIDSRGRKIVQRPLVAQFRQGLFSVPRWVKPDQAEYLLKHLRAHPCIKSKEVWEQDNLKHAVLVNKVATVLDSMKKDPDLKKTVMDFLEQEDYTDEVETPPVDEAVEAAAEEIEEPVEEEVMAEVVAPSGRRLKRKVRRR